MSRRALRAARRAVARVAAPGIAALLLILAGVATAQASQTYAQVGEIPGFEFPIGGVAVDNLTGDLYVVDGARAVVDKYDASGTLISSFGEPGTGEGQFGQEFFSGPYGIAVDQSSGDVYVVDRANNRVEKFDASGSYLSQFDGSATPAGSLSFPSAVAVDPTSGDVYVVDAGNDVVDKFDSAGHIVTAFGTSGALAGTPESSFAFPISPEASPGLAVDSSGRLYVGDPGNHVVDEFNPSGEFEGKLGTETLLAPSVLAVDSADHVFVADSSSQSIVKFDSEGHHVLGFPTDTSGTPRGVAVAGDASHVYLSGLSSSFFEPGVVRIFAFVTLPDVTTAPPSNVQQTTATFEGTVNPDGVQLTDCHFVYTDQADFEANGYAGPDVRTAPCSPEASAISADHEGHAVTGEATGLTPNTTYHFRLEAANANGSSHGEDRAFRTPGPPALTSTSVSDVTTTEAVLEGQIDPEGFDTTYRFEYGTTTAYGADTPVPDGALAAGTSVAPVTGPVASLTPATVYHFRLVAHSAQGTSAGPDHTFTTYPAPVASHCPNERLREENNSTALPDCRAYELVTPSDKNGSNVGLPAEEANAAVAADGQHVQYATALLGSFGDATSGVGDMFVASRGSSGWESHFAALPASSHPEAPDFANPVGASEGFSTILYQTTVGVDPGDQNGTTDVYARNPDGSVSWISQNGSVSTEAVASEFAGSSVDARHVLFQAERSLTPATKGLVAGNELYDRVGETTIPVGVNTNGSLVSSCGAIAGSGDRSGGGNTNSNAISHDGSRIFFESPDPSGAGDASCSPTQGGSQPVELFLRQDAATTTEISLSQRPGSVGTPAPDGVTYQGASSDGARVFFTSPDLLTGDAVVQPGEVEALYVYDVARGELTFIASGKPLFGQGGRPMISDDGSHVYFVGRVPGKESGRENLYLWDEGAISYISSAPTANGEDAVAPDARLSSDGSALVFTSASNLTDYNSNGHTEIYLYRERTESVVCISCDPNSSIPSAAQLSPDLGDTSGFLGVHLNQAITSDGREVFFDSPVPLAAGDANTGVNPSCQARSREEPTTGCDVYEWENGTVRLLSGGAGRSAHLVGISSDGSDVVINTSNPLAPQDQDGGYGDLYDVRVDGGFPASQSPAPCISEGCRPLGGPGAALPMPGSVTFLGAGNSRPASATTGRLAVVRKAGARRSLLLTISIPASGRILISGRGVKRISKSLSRAGVYRIVIPLTKRELSLLKRRHALRLHAKLAFRLTGGGTQSTSVSVTVKA